jgi:hypothetical protein
MKEGTRSEQRTVGDLVLDYRNYVFNCASRSPHLTPLGDFLINSGNEPYSDGCVNILEWIELNGKVGHWYGKMIWIFNPATRCASSYFANISSTVHSEAKAEHNFNGALSLCDFLEKPKEVPFQLRVVISSMTQATTAVLGSRLPIAPEFFNGHLLYSFGEIPSPDYYRVPFYSVQESYYGSIVSGLISGIIMTESDGVTGLSFHSLL